MEQKFQILTDLNIQYELQEHKAIFSEALTELQAVKWLQNYAKSLKKNLESWEMRFMFPTGERPTGAGRLLFLEIHVNNKST